MAPAEARLSMYGTEQTHEQLAWDWVEGQLAAAGTYWVTTGTGADPHPRPVWGVWLDGALLLSVGSPTLRRAIEDGAPVTVHLDSGTDVVIVNGAARTDRSPETLAAFVAAYDPKYDWAYDIDQYGPPSRVTPTEVLAWRSAGPAGREGFVSSGKWTFGAP